MAELGVRGRVRSSQRTVVVDSGTRNQYANGCDSWPVTWADDDKLYFLGNDGDGWDATRVDGMTVCSLTGDPTGNFVTNGAEISSKVNVLGVGIICVGGVLYINEQDRTAFDKSRFGHSSNHGTSFTYPAGTGWDYTSVFNGATFVQYGKNYAGGDASYVYFTNPMPTGYILGRAPLASIDTQASHEFFSGTPASPAWTSTLGSTATIPVCQNTESQFGITYNSVRGKYVAGMSRGQHGDYSFHEADNPWGPWTEVAYVYGLGGDGSQKFGLTFVNKTNWISSDGLSWWFLISGLNTWDGLNALQAVWTTREIGAAA